MFNYDEFDLDNSLNLVHENNTKYRINLKDRLLNFAVETLKFIGKIPDKSEYKVIKYQLSKSVTSIGANFEEAQSSGDKEFRPKLRVALREANETYYWFKIIDKLDLGIVEKRKNLITESKEITLILGSIVSKLYKKMNK